MHTIYVLEVLSRLVQYRLEQELMSATSSSVRLRKDCLGSTDCVGYVDVLVETRGRHFGY
jgi:hypothetical protein